MAEVKLDPQIEADKVKAQFDGLVRQRDQAANQRANIDRALNEIGMGLLRLQGEYAALMRVMGKDPEGNALDVPPTKREEAKKEEPKKVIPKERKK